MPVFDYVGQNNDKVWLKYSYEYRVYWSHIPQVSLVRGPHHLASSEVDASTQKIDLTDVVNGNVYYMAELLHGMLLYNLVTAFQCCTRHCSISEINPETAVYKSLYAY